MANKKLSYNQIADKNLLEPLIKELKQVNELLKMTEDGLKGVIEEGAKLAKAEPTKGYEDLKKVEKGINDVKKAVTDLDKVEKDRVKLEEKIAELDDERIKRNFELREQLKLQTKELRDQAKESVAGVNAYQRLTKQTNAAQAEFKRLAAQFGTTSKEAKEARKDFERLDEELREINEAARDGRRDVGRYEKATQKLGKSFKALASAAIVLKVLELAGQAFSNNTEGAAQFEKVIVRVTTAVGVFVNRFVQAIPILQARFERFIVNIQLGFANLTNLMGTNQQEVDRLTKEYENLSKVADQDVSDAFAGMTDEISNLIDEKIKLIDLTIEYRKDIIELNKEIASLTPQQAKLRQEFEDATNSLDEQIAAGVALQAQNELIFQDQLRIAQLELDLATRRAATNKANLDAQEELADAVLAFAELEASIADERKATEAELQTLRDDVTERNLDFYIDDFDNRKTVNERIIADETQTFAKRNELLQQNLKLTEDAFDNEEAELNQSLEQRGKALLDFEELRKMTSSAEIARIIEESGLSDRLAGRALEVIRERRTFLQDNAEAQRDLNEAEKEAALISDDLVLTNQALLELQEQNVDVQMILDRLSQERLQNEIDNLQEQLAVAEDGSAQFLNINQELNEKLLQQNQERIAKEQEEKDKAAEADKERLEKQRQLQETIFGALSELISSRFEENIANIDDEIAAEEKRAEKLRELAAEGNEDAENNLALTQKRQAEAELERERQLKRQQQSEFVLSAINTYSQKVANEEPNPLASTVADISVLKAFLGTLQGFFYGTEDTGSYGAISDEYGKITGFTHENERVLTKDQNKMVGNMSNMELAMLAQNSRASKASPKQIADERLISEIKGLKQIINDKPSYMGMDFDKQAEVVTHMIEKKGIKERKHVRIGGVWGK